VALFPRLSPPHLVCDQPIRRRRCAGWGRSAAEACLVVPDGPRSERLGDAWTVRGPRVERRACRFDAWSRPGSTWPARTLSPGASAGPARAAVAEWGVGTLGSHGPGPRAAAARTARSCRTSRAAWRVLRSPSGAWARRGPAPAGRSPPAGAPPAATPPPAPHPRPGHDDAGGPKAAGVSTERRCPGLVLSASRPTGH
jgi:hypothetical protein